MTPNIVFFQAAATVIPTLLVAAAVTAKTFDVGDYPDDAAVMKEARTPEEKTPKARANILLLAERAWWMRTTLLVLIFTAFTVATITGERAALAALIENKPTTQRRDQVYVGITAELALLVLAASTSLTKPIIRHATGRYQAALGTMLCLTIGIGIAVALGWSV